MVTVTDGQTKGQGSEELLYENDLVIKHLIYMLKHLIKQG